MCRCSVPAFHDHGAAFPLGCARLGCGLRPRQMPASPVRCAAHGRHRKRLRSCHVELAYREDARATRTMRGGKHRRMSRKLELVREEKLFRLLPGRKESSRLVASGVVLLDDATVLIVIDNLNWSRASISPSSAGPATGSFPLRAWDRVSRTSPSTTSVETGPSSVGLAVRAFAALRANRDPSPSRTIIAPWQCSAPHPSPVIDRARWDHMSRPA
jgi:hypothetical protein